MFVEKKMWQEYYHNEDGSLIRDICMEDDGCLVYQIVFDFESKRYYCYIDAFNVEEALGIFFINHDNVMYSHVIDHFEVQF